MTVHPILRLSHDLNVGLGVEHRTQAAADYRVVVSEQHPGLERRGHRLDRDAQQHVRAALSARADVELGVDHVRALTHAAQAPLLGVGRQPATVVGDLEHHAPFLCAQLDHDLEPWLKNETNEGVDILDRARRLPNGFGLPDVPVL